MRVCVHACVHVHAQVTLNSMSVNCAGPLHKIVFNKYSTFIFILQIFKEVQGNACIHLEILSIWNRNNSKFESCLCTNCFLFSLTVSWIISQFLCFEAEIAVSEFYCEWSVPLTSMVFKDQPCVCVSHISVNSCWHWGCFHALTVVNNTLVNTEGAISLISCIHLLWL